MRTRSAFRTALLTVSLAALAIACTPEATAPAHIDPERVAIDKKVDELKGKYGWMGKYHTDGLEYVFAELNQLRGNSGKNDYCKVAAKAIKDFHRQARRGEIPFQFVDPGIEMETCGTEVGNSRLGKNVMIAPRATTNTLSPLATSYIDQVVTAIHSATSRQALVNRLLSIQYAAVTNLPFDEAGAVVATVSIAISSAEYWEIYLENWINLPGEFKSPYSKASLLGPIAALFQCTWPTWWSHPVVTNYRRVVAADAIAGLRVIYTTWRLGPIGWDAAAAAALYGSVTTALSLMF